MKDKDYIKDLFSEKLSGFEANVRPELWTSISSQIGAPVVEATGISLITKAIIGVSIAASVGTIAVYLFTRSNGENHLKVTEESNTNLRESKTQSLVVPDNKGLQPKPNSQSNTVIERNRKDDQVNNQTYESEYTVDSGSEQSKKNDDSNKNIFPVYDENIANQNKENSPVEDKKTLVKEEKHTEPSNVITPQIGEEETTKETDSSIKDLPNIFTPNGDGTNDYLSVKANNVSDFSVVVLNQDNKIVYQSTDPEFSWNGTEISGEPVPNGIYVYYITARNGKGELITKHSRLTINR